MSLNLINPLDINDESILILYRIDNSINSINYTEINKLLIDHDIIVHAELPDKSLIDHYFIIKKNNIYILQNLYDNYLNYCADWENNINRNELTSTRPEAIIYYHLMLHNKKIAFANVIDFNFIHTCNIFCGHNGINTKT
jgi:hypothetical protein